MKKYKLTDETKIASGTTLRRIEALRDFGIVKSGDLGGWVESENNLSHNGNCWIYNDALVSGDAKVFDDARVFGYARVYGNARVFGNARVYGHAWVCDNTRIH